jgi:thiamine transport system permease protein
VRKTTGLKPERGPLLIGSGALFFGVFFILPLGYFYFLAWAEAPGLRFPAVFLRVLTAGPTVRILFFSLAQAGLSAAFCVLLALPGAFLSSRYDYPLKRFFRSLSLVPFVLPSIIVVLCMISFYGKNGVINRLFGLDLNIIYNPGGIILAHGFYNVSLALRIMSDGLAEVDSRYREIASSLGDGPVRGFFRVVFPLLLPSMITSFVLIFLYCFLSFGVVLVFGGFKYATFEVKIYTDMFIALDLPSAAAHSLLQLFLSAGLLFAAGKTIRNFQFARSRAPKNPTTPLSRERFLKRLLAFLYFLFLGLFLFGPIAAVTLRAFSPGGVFTVDSFIALFKPELSSRDITGLLRSTVPGVILRSVLFAFASGGLTFLIAMSLSLALRGKNPPYIEGFFFLPAGMSLVSLGIGMGLLYGERLPRPLLIIITQVFLAFPFVFRILKTTVGDFHERYGEAAKSLGAGDRRILFDVKLPIMKRGLLNGFAYSVAIPFTDFTAVMSVGRGEIATFPVAIYRLIGFRSYDLGLALGVIYILICLGIFLWIDSTSLKENGGGGWSGSRA